MNSSAQDEFSSFLNEFDIDKKLFVGPSVSADSVNNSYHIYTWKTSTDLVTKPIIIEVKVYKGVIMPPRVALIGDTEGWGKLYFTDRAHN